MLVQSSCARGEVKPGLCPPRPQEHCSAPHRSVFLKPGTGLRRGHVGPCEDKAPSLPGRVALRKSRCLYLKISHSVGLQEAGA